MHAYDNTVFSNCTEEDKTKLKKKEIPRMNQSSSVATSVLYVLPKRVNHLHINMLIY